ncbi:hypothetical protein FACS1894189_8290 [Planctomycetales bacterium]|nr:hypothetical protein FACS1894189_8290 [Planctomycetales bacterium]
MKITLSDGTVKEYKNSDSEALDILRHSTAHLMARAVMRLYENVQLAFGPNTDNGFYYDIAMEHKLSEDDFTAIEAEMKKLIKLNEVWEHPLLIYSSRNPNLMQYQIIFNGILSMSSAIFIQNSQSLN